VDFVAFGACCLGIAVPFFELSCFVAGAFVEASHWLMFFPGDENKKLQAKLFFSVVGKILSLFIIIELWVLSSLLLESQNII
ncbi:3544_t:CDS:2, partial [Gigaspora rosea]